MNADLQTLQSSWPRLDVPGEYRAACAKYGRGNVTLDWLEACWLPRSRPRRSFQRKKANRHAFARDQAWAIASTATAPDGWSAWWATAHPGVDVPAWSSAPLFYRQAYAWQAMAGSTGQAGASQPRAPRNVDATSTGEARGGATPTP
jgi:hypothetical protein